MTNRKPTIYLVDDHKSFIYLTKHVVDHYHNSYCEVFEYSDAELAMEVILAEPNKPDYVFLDLSMPKIDGWKFLDGLKNGIGVDRLPFEIIIITGSESPDDYDIAMMNENVTHFIPKPIDMKKIKQIFESDKYLRSFRKMEA